MTSDCFAEIACIWEVSARKPGNVHPTAEFHDLSSLDFLLSASTMRSGFADFDKLGVGERVRRAILETRKVVGRNTNLGIVLLLAPLLDSSESPVPSLRSLLMRVLESLSREDAAAVYEAIRLANPGGLGDAPQQDVRDEPTVTLLEAMKLAADRDMIARQYANGFADVFDFGTPAFLDAFAKFGCVEAAIIDCQLRWLAAFPDSLIARKNGDHVAEDVQKRAAGVQNLGGIATPEGRAAGVELDQYLRSDGNRLNPGTTADLIAACLFVALREGRIAPSAPFRWTVSDWL